MCLRPSAATDILTALSSGAGCRILATSTLVDAESVFVVVGIHGWITADHPPDNLHQRNLLSLNPHRRCGVPELGATLHHSHSYGHRHGPQGLLGAYLRRRELPSQDPWSAGHVVADVDRLRNLLGVLR